MKLKIKEATFHLFPVGTCPYSNDDFSNSTFLTSLLDIDNENKKQ